MKAIRVLVLLAVATCAFGAGMFFSAQNETQATLLLGGSESVPAGVDMAPVWKAWRLLEEQYVPSGTTSVAVTPQDRVWGMIEGLAKSYGDPYTVFMPPRESARFADDIRGSFGGVGIEIGMREGILTVIAPLKGTPGEKMGLRSGDFIAKINEVSTQDMSIDEAIERIRGEVGTEVVLTIAREGESEFLTFSIIREVIEIPTIETEYRDDGVFVISLYNFGETSDTEFRSALREFLKTGSDNLIIDLRGNPGGYLDSAVEMASMFLPVGTLVVTEDHGTTEYAHRSRGNNVIPKDVSVVVLVDRGSASASEILAGALRAHDRATLIGVRTFGKGSVQTLLEVTPQPKTSLKITVARWLTPDDVSISENGLTPDYEVSLEREDVEAERDPQLDAAVAFLTTGTVPQVTNASSTENALTD